MSYQVLARKWRPQSFDAVVGQPAVTQTLRNAIAGERVHHAFVFAGPRGVGKTTTARILARALNCDQGPTAEPCGTCPACVEIAEGRDMDVLEIDAATHTQVETVREVIISGLAIMPVRDRYKVFIIDEVHQLSPSSFNALLKSVEEPPPHVVFMMATTEIGKIPDTILSRAQVFEFHTIPTRQIAEHLRVMADAEGLTVPDEALALIARSAEGSMRDAQSAMDQVIAFAGATMTVEDVTIVLGLVGRDVLFEVVGIVADEDPSGAFALTARIVEEGYDLRLVCRELSRLVRDLLVISVDPSRVADPEIAGESEREALPALAARFSREDLLRAFDVLSRAEFEVRTSAQPRYAFEMALLRWIHLRKLVPLEDLLAGAESGGGPVASRPPARTVARPPARTAAHPQPGPVQRSASPSTTPAGPKAERRLSRPAPPAPPSSAPVAAASRPAPAAKAAGPAPADPPPASARPSRGAKPAGAAEDAPGHEIKDRFLAEVRRARAVLFNTVIAQAQKIEATGDRITFSFAPNHRTLRERLEQSRAFLERLAESVAGRHIGVVAVEIDAGEAAAAAAAVTAAGETGPAGAAAGGGEGTSGTAPRAAPADLRAEAMADDAVQAMLDVFPAEIRDVEEL